ncbi:hypothetical protein [Actinoplanes flavus]|uniref:Uncharacterized protein n=1 Tax=Actinoplanes flavus TaxID=2820290 RepID=A0ABS3UCV6_9ACTN|nr:hypothetical protein [Actinoplanes flavus]MBO3736611.1 hypothetical protein [Actinoplanes flavus]
MPIRPTPSTTDLAELTLLPEAAAGRKVSAAPGDVAVTAGTAGVIVHNRQPVHIYTRPGGPAIAWLPTQQCGSDTWLPVIDQQPGWVRVLLPSHPNGARGWITTSDLDRSHTPHEIRVHRRSGRLQLLTDGRLTGGWQVAAGSEQTPLPDGRTFLLALVPGAERRPSPRVLALATHSPASPTCTGIPGTVAIHPGPGVTDDDDPCRACLRVPAAAFDALTQVRPGSLVRIYR